MWYPLFSRVPSLLLLPQPAFCTVNAMFQTEGEYRHIQSDSMRKIMFFLNIETCKHVLRDGTLEIDDGDAHR